MPGYIFEALKFIGKVGVVTRPTWYQHLCPGTDQWKREQLLNMVKRKILLPHTCHGLKGAWVLSPWSTDFLKKKGLSAVTPVPPHQIEHDEVIGRSALILKRNGFCKGWLTERELKHRGMTQFQIEKSKTSEKYPDAIFQMMINDKEKFIALEYERTGKSSLRYRSMLKKYGKLETLELILYVTEDDAIEKRIRRILMASRDGSLMKRVAFIKGRDWRSDPSAAPFFIEQKISSLSKLAS